MVESRRGWSYPLLWSAYQYAGLETVSFRSRRSLASRSLPTEPERACSLAAHETTHRPLAPSGPNLSSLSFVPGARHHLWQHPNAGNPLVPIRAGRTHRFVSLPVPLVSTGITTAPTPGPP